MADLHQMLSAALGPRYQDLRGELPTRPNGPNGDFSSRALRGIDTIAIHHTAGPRAQSWQSIAAFHIGPQRNWAGIGYHLGIRQGRLAYLGGIEKGRACVQNLNNSVICVVLTGDYVKGKPDPADVQLLRETVAVIQRWAIATLGHSLKIRGHQELGQTECPGVHLMPVVRELAAGTVLTPDPPVPTIDRAALLSAAKARQLIQLNPRGALQTRMAADKFVPTSNEFQSGGLTAQLAERLSDGRVRVYWAPTGRWNQVQYIEQ